MTGIADRVDLDLLDRYLLSDEAPDNGMALSDLDGFLTGILVGPELIIPSEWLPHIWGGEPPKFANDRAGTPDPVDHHGPLQRNRRRPRSRAGRVRPCV